MKRFYKFLSLFLLSLVGITSAVAQDYKKGTLLTTTEQVVSQRVVLWSPGTSDDHPAGFMNGKNVLCEILTDSCIYEFEAVGTQVDGHDLYRLKQVASGLYVKDADGMDEDAFEYTDKVGEAFEMTVLPFEDVTGADVRCNRTTATDAKQDLSVEGFVLCRGEMAPKPFEDAPNDGYVYIGAVHSPFISPYTDTNVWNIYTVENTRGKEKVDNYLNMYFPGALETDYPKGNAPGYYQAEVVDEVAVLVDKASDVSNGTLTLSDEEIDKLCADLKAGYEKLQASRIPLAEGYFFIRNVANRYLYDGVQDDKHFVYTNAAGTYTIPEALTPDDVKLIWKVAPAEGENKYVITNMYSDLVISGNEADCSGTDNGKGFLLEAEGNITVSPNGENDAPSFLFITSATTKNGMKQFHGKFNNNPVMAWNANASENNCMKFIPVSEADVMAVLEQAKQQARNEKLSAAYSQALSTVLEGTSYKWNGEKNAEFTLEGALVSYTGDEANSHVFSANKSAAEGTYEGLVDGDFETYFHSDYSRAFTPSMTNFHDISFELDKAASGIITAKIAKRKTGNDYPTKFAIFGSNEVDKADPNAADWTLEGVATISWDTPAMVDTVKKEKFVGYATFNLSQEYKYVRFGAIGTIFNESNPMTNRGYFAISEMNLWKGGVYDDVNSTISVVSKETMDALNAALAKAKAELAAGAATEETIAELNAAYAKFVEEFPVPALIAEAASAAEAVANNATNNDLVGEELGQYPSAAHEALVAAIQAARDYDTKGKTAAEINAQVKAVEDAVAAFYTTINLPEAGKYYVWRGTGDNYRGGAEANGWNSLNALVYSPSNALNTNLAFTRPEGAAEGLDVAELTDTVSATENLKYAWFVEKAEAGKMVIRNVGTGMYVAAKDGAVAQSKEPFEIEVLPAVKGSFVLVVKDGGHFNAHAGGQVGVWNSATDKNAFWTFQEVAEDQFSGSTTYYWPATPGKYEIITLPVSVDWVMDGTAYGVAGVTADNELALVKLDDIIPAGTPFIHLANETFSEPKYGASFNLVFGGDGEALPRNIEYVTEPVVTECLTGTLCEVDTVPAGYAYFNNGNVAATKNTVIGANSGFLGVIGQAMPVADAEMADVTIALGKVVIDEINEANVVVLPALSNVYSINGQLVRKNVKTVNALKGLPAGIYVVGGKKFIVK